MPTYAIVSADDLKKLEIVEIVEFKSGLNPLPAYDPPSRERLPEVETRRYPLLLVTGDREKSYHHSRFRDQPWATKVSPDPFYDAAVRSMSLSWHNFFFGAFEPSASVSIDKRSSARISSGSHWWWKRGAFTASWISSP